MFSKAMLACTDERLPANGMLLCGIVTFLISLTGCIPATANAQTQTPDMEGIFAEASAARIRGDIPQAIQLYQEVVQAKPDWPDGWWYLGSLEYGANDYGAASSALNHYIGLMPKAGPAYALKGLCEFEDGQYAQSLQDIQNALALGAAAQRKNAAILYYHRGLLLAKLGRFEEALGQYTQLVKQDSVDQDLVLAIGLSGLRQPIFPKDIDSSQRDLVVAVGHAAAEYMGGDAMGASDAFSDLFTRFPTTPNLHYLYGYLLFPTSPQDGIAQFKAELAISPANAVTNAMLAWAYGMQGAFQTSLPYAQHAVDEDPSLPMSQLVLGRALVETAKPAEGLQHLDAVLTTEPNNLEAHLALVKAYSKLGKSEDARRERLQCLALSGQETPANASM